MDIKKCPVLQSGFVSYTPVGMMKPDKVNQTFAATILGKDVENPMEDYFYSREVELLITQWKNFPKDFKTFEFRERVMKAAITCFSTKSIRHWVELQDHQPTLGNLHKQMLLETVNFVVHDIPRPMECLQWCRLLFPETGYSLNLHEVTEVLTSERAKEHRFGNLVNTLPFIQAWVARPDGYADLLKTLHAVFGRRHGVGPRQSR